MAACEQSENAEPRAVREVALGMEACPVELDYLYSTVDRLYYEVAHDCGLSTSAFWMLYELHRTDGAVSIKKLNVSWSFSKQTINSALKTLEGKGLVAYAYLEGSRKNKSVSLTEAGRVFARRYIQPAIAAEGRAFFGLTEDERAAMLATISKYARALSAEFERARAEVAASGASAHGAVSAEGASAAGALGASDAPTEGGATARGTEAVRAPAGNDKAAGAPAAAVRSDARGAARKPERSLMQGEEGRV